jgi:hypothetical protein
MLAPAWTKRQPPAQHVLQSPSRMMQPGAVHTALSAVAILNYARAGRNSAESCDDEYVAE